MLLWVLNIFYVLIAIAMIALILMQRGAGAAAGASFGGGASGTVFGGLGVLGPTRMDYPGTIASVAAVARYVGEVLAER